MDASIAPPPKPGKLNRGYQHKAHQNEAAGGGNNVKEALEASQANLRAQMTGGFKGLFAVAGWVYGSCFKV